MAFSSSAGENNGLMGEINVTPFVDVMLVLLVIFMVTAPLVQQQVDVDLPETKSKQSMSVRENDIVLTVDKKQQISLAGAQVPLGALEAKLQEIYRNKTKKEIFFRADKGVPYGFVVKVMALVKEAGVDKMGMITDSETAP